MSFLKSCIYMGVKSSELRYHQPTIKSNLLSSSGVQLPYHHIPFVPASRTPSFISLNVEPGPKRTSLL